MHPGRGCRMLVTCTAPAATASTCPAPHLSMNSLPPWKLLMCHTSALFSGTYDALPWDVLNDGAVASAGSGRWISTFVAELRSLNWLRALTRYSVRLRLGFSTRHSTQMRGLGAGGWGAGVSSGMQARARDGCAAMGCVDCIALRRRTGGCCTCYECRPMWL
jgi:hypothetical protein